MSTNITDEKKQEAANALKDGLKAGYEASKGKSLKWWERVAWIVLAGVAYLASSLLSSCTMHLTKLPDGTLSFSVGEQPAPVVVKEGK